MQAMSRASDEGLIFIEGTGPTYATHTVMFDVLFFPNPFRVVFCALHDFMNVVDLLCIVFKTSIFSSLIMMVWLSDA